MKIENPEILKSLMLWRYADRCATENGIGSTVAMTNQSQTIVNTYTYAPFGKLTTESETVPQPFKYVGQYGIMTETNNLLYMRARYYDADTGRFISEDPSGLSGGVNLYAYVRNNPINFFDLDGFGRKRADTKKYLSRPTGRLDLSVSIPLGNSGFVAVGGLQIGGEGISVFRGTGKGGGFSASAVFTVGELPSDGTYAYTSIKSGAGVGGVFSATSKLAPEAEFGSGKFKAGLVVGTSVSAGIRQSTKIANFRGGK